ncbi:MAG: sigma-54-dependent Fis family transcriptional regulator, partial [Deltaproteobacteria bacterium]|nr:sigma-54-dependent Fis family transcriptional regulator [Deltaproteobacteria bacterium]
KFRQDLYFRINVVPISIPPLRERKEDIPLLAQHFLNKFNIAFHKKISGFSEKTLDALCRYHWPGNIRELENLIERITVLSKDNNPIQLKDIPFEILISPDQDIKGKVFPKTGLIQAKEEYEKRLILNALESTQWNQGEAAKILKISRNYFLRKIKQFGIRIKKVN